MPLTEPYQADAGVYYVYILCNVSSGTTPTVRVGNLQAGAVDYFGDGLFLNYVSISNSTPPSTILKSSVSASAVKNNIMIYLRDKR